MGNFRTKGLEHEVAGRTRLPRYCREYHTSDVELGALAKRVRPGMLFLDHIIRMGASDEEILPGVRAGGYEGKVVVGQDLARV